MQDDLDRLFLSLVHTLRERAPGDLHRPLEVLELVQDIVPYRALRRTRGFDANEDYEHAMTRLLSGERSYLRGDARMQQVLVDELATPTPNTSLFREFARNHVAITAEGLVAAGALAADLVATTTPAGRTSGPTPAVIAPSEANRRSGVSAAFAAFDAPIHLPASAPPAPESAMAVTPMRFVTSTQLGGKCRYCSAALPDGRKLVYCPFCGHDLTMQQCPSCSTELELGWKFCVTCGRTATAPTTGEFPAQKGS